MPDYSSQTTDWNGSLLSLHALNPDRYPCLLESVDQPGTLRWDILFCHPANTVTLYADGRIEGSSANTFLDALDQAFSKDKQPLTDSESLPFTGGWFVYLGYELAGEIEPRLKLPSGRSTLPVAHLIRIPAAVMRERVSGRTCLLAEAGRSDLLSIMQADISKLSNIEESIGDNKPAFEIEEDHPEDFLDGVARIKDYIVEGDVFQVNLSREWRARRSDRRPVDPVSLYRALRLSNPGPFNGLARICGHSILSSSPERLVQLNGKRIEARPIAGTRPRGAEQMQDNDLAQELIDHPKERAEHIMLIDLERNDLGRVCVPGSIKVDELMSVESYSHVHHIVSNIEGTPVPGTTPGHIIRAMFPGGTITGCPKVRCMEIIAELEKTARGPYTGSFGYIGRDGRMDLNILIRTLVANDELVRFRAGAGIVADSDPRAELEETRAKAQGLLLALNDISEVPEA